MIYNEIYLFLKFHSDFTSGYTKIGGKVFKDLVRM